MTQFNSDYITQKAKELFKQERAIKRLDGWFLMKEANMKYSPSLSEFPLMERSANVLKKAIADLPIDISDNAIFAGTQRDAFARSYALINPSFKVETFNGYCDPTAVYGDIEPNEEFTKERIDKVCNFDKTTPYVKQLSQVYESVEQLTGEVSFFIEQVTGHLIPDMRPAIKYGVNALISDIDVKIKTANDDKKSNYKAMKTALECVILLAKRYEEIARKNAENALPERKAELLLLADTLNKVPLNGAKTLYEAIQSFILLWQVMCLEQAPNPFAFSVGNADRIFEPYRAADNMPRDKAAALFKHFLVFFNVADRSWAISQNVILSGRDEKGNDLTNETTYALLDAYYDMNLPQPILSVKFHKNTPDRLYRELGRFFFTPGCLTPSMFNDDSLFETLYKSGVELNDIPDTAIAGCQEPLIMGKDNGNTTNSWLNLGKILELTLNDGISTITGEKIGTVCEPLDALSALKNIRERFYENVEFYLSKMVEAANGASKALSNLPVPFLSAHMGGIETGFDTRDTENQGTKYNGSGCLIHGTSVVSDSFVAIDNLLKERPEDAKRLLTALQNNFEGDDELHEYLLNQPKFGNNIVCADDEAAEVTNRIADMVRECKNYLGNPFRPDFSTPSTHLLYGYWVGALPNARKQREMLNYGVDPLYGDAQQGLGLRTLSLMKLPFEKMPGGYASHYGIDPKYFTSESFEDKGLEFKTRVIQPLFFNPLNEKTAPFYLYVNVTTPEILKMVLENPEEYAPNGVYIMRIHGTFVNFLDLSPAIQQDIIKRLDPASTSICC
ncbi:MAG TPA: pyruvate formate lyase family protein [Oscillospiraceae bacterium]|nr:pyruvate formate lyase family protein [Oscillospiraceae bacterium]